jgi:biotin transport system substrate-specific component
MFFTTRSSESILSVVRERSDLFLKILGSSIFALFMCASSLSFKLWFTPVPVTLQVLGVVLSGLVLGSRWGAVSQIQYLTMGLCGLPVFSHGQAGPAVLGGPTGGYLVGFVLGAFVVGWIYERFKCRPPYSWIAGLGGVGVVYLLGACWLMVWISMTTGKPVAFCANSAWQLGIAPFIGIDLLKVVLASGIIGAIGWFKK